MQTPAALDPCYFGGNFGAVCIIVIKFSLLSSDSYDWTVNTTKASPKDPTTGRHWWLARNGLQDFSYHLRRLAAQVKRVAANRDSVSTTHDRADETRHRWRPFDTQNVRPAGECRKS